MKFLIGTDEAGYGPNLGPLVVSATVWRIVSPRKDDCLYQRLAEAITPTAPAPGDNRLHLGDSKAVYTSTGGLGALERGALAILSLLHEPPQDWPAVWRSLAPLAWQEISAADCYRGYTCDVPLVACAADVARASARLASACAAEGVELLAVKSRVVFPQEFNDLRESEGNKASALSRVTLQLAAEMLDPLPDGQVELTCDKHGGRNTYAPLLQRHVTEQWVECVREGRDESRYRYGPPQRRVEARFCSKAERFLPVAVASMMSKYLRELAMQAFNAFWSKHLPALRPTAGYPGDARRFKSEISAVQAALGMDDRVLWRAK